LSQLPPGWKREEVFRCNGLNSGKSIVFYVTPTGQQARTPKELQLLLGDKFDVADFDWRSGKFSSQSLKSKTNDSTPKSKSPEFSFPVDRSDDKTDWFSRRVSPPLPKPLIVSSHNDSKRIEKPSTADCPKQLFSELRLSDSQTIDSRTGFALPPPTLPKIIQTAGAPGYNEFHLIHNLMCALSGASGPITGQDQPVPTIEKNPCASLNHAQPFVKVTFSIFISSMFKNLIITDEDIRKQQHRVKELRRKLEAARRKYNPFLSSKYPSRVWYGFLTLARSSHRLCFSCGDIVWGLGAVSRRTKEAGIRRRGPSYPTVNIIPRVGSSSAILLPCPAASRKV
uniref:MBD domain-containing protein n=1 Tax=Schistocephalus solidus TaxID=70667 RepID=A0A183TG79_SCHSO